MDYEKKYKEALEKAKELQHDNCWVTTIFPELKENEDEKIRKDIIGYLQYSMAFDKSFLDEKYNWSQKDCSKWIAWLEKQGEQKPTDKVEPKFKVGDEIKTANEEPLIITKIDEEGYWSEDLFICGFDEECIWDLVEQKPATMSLDEAIEHCKKKSCGNSACALEHKQLEKWLTELKELKEQKPAWSEEDEETYYGVIETEQYMLDVVNGIKKFDVGNISIKEECARELNWLKSLKDRVQSKQKQEWSEEDKANLLDVKCIIDEVWENQLVSEELGHSGEELESLWHWLNNLWERVEYPQPTWKPSEEQMKALWEAYKGGKEQASLATLYSDLKKLREE